MCANFDKISGGKFDLSSKTYKIIFFIKKKMLVPILSGTAKCAILTHFMSHLAHLSHLTHLAQAAWLPEKLLQRLKFIQFFLTMDIDSARLANTVPENCHERDTCL